jgi:hypothetical protein
MKILKILFILILSNLSVFAQPKIEIFNNIHDFQSITEGSKYEAEFNVKNIGNQPLMITNVASSCGCLSTVFAKEAIQPNEAKIVKLIYNSAGRMGSFAKSATLISNAVNEASIVLTVKGNVVDKNAANNVISKVTNNSVDVNKEPVKSSQKKSTVKNTSNSSKNNKIPPIITIDYEQQKENYNALAQRLANKYCKQINPNTGKNATYQFESDEYKNDTRKVNFEWTAGRCMFCPNETMAISGTLNLKTEAFTLEGQNNAVSATSSFYDFMKEFGSSSSSSSSASSSNTSSNSSDNSILNSSNCRIDLETNTTRHVGVTLGTGFNCYAKNVSVSIVSKQDGKVIKQYNKSKESSITESWSISNYDLPVIVNISYTKDCAFSSNVQLSAQILVNKHCYIKVRPN